MPICGSWAKGSWVVIDEVQKIPALLNEVHALIFQHDKKYRFALSGSSARKLKSQDSNLLAGRAVNRAFFPLTVAELNYQFEVDELLKTGGLPKVRAEPKSAVEILEAYVTSYLQQEIQQEAYTRNFPSFVRFLEVAAIMNGQIVNTSQTASDAGVARQTVQNYFQILVDTMIGVFLTSWKPRAKVRESAHPKFYFFDTGVVRAICGHLRDPLDRTERGVLFETLILHELRSWINISQIGGKLSYWHIPSELEVDFVWSRGTLNIAIEVKSTTEWKARFSTSLKKLYETGLLTRAYGVYLGYSALQDGPITVLPFVEFIRKLNTGEILRPTAKSLGVKK